MKRVLVALALVVLLVAVAFAAFASKSVTLPTTNYGVFASTEHLQFYTTAAGDVNCGRVVIAMASGGTASFWNYTGAAWERMAPLNIDAATDTTYSLTSTLLFYEFIFTGATRPDIVYLTGTGSIWWE